MRFSDRPKVKAFLSADGEIMWDTPSAIDGYADISRSTEYGETLPYLLTKGNDYEFGYATWVYDPEATPVFTNYREVVQTNVGGGDGFPNGTTGLELSFVAGKHNFVSSTCGTSSNPPETGGINATAVGPDAKALADYSMALGKSCDAKGLNSVAVGYYAEAWGEGSVAIGTTRAVKYGELAIGPSSPMKDAVFGVYANTGINETDRLRHALHSAHTDGPFVEFGQNIDGNDGNCAMFVTLDLYLTPGNASSPGTLTSIKIVQVTFLVASFSYGTSEFSTPTVTTIVNSASIPTPTFTLVSGADGAISMNVEGVAYVHARGNARVKRMFF